MKNIFKILLVISAVAFVAGLIFLISMFFIAENVREEIDSTAFVVIELQEDIPGLKNIELKMCELISTYNMQSTTDTISENVAVPYKELPCKARVRYIFEDGTSKEIPTEDFNCAGCSGTHLYSLSRDSVKYKYLP